MSTCQRCNTSTRAFTFSYFNTQMICTTCQIEESQHPDYAKAKREEFESLKSGNYNYEGIGLPEDLIKKYNLV